MPEILTANSKTMQKSEDPKGELKASLTSLATLGNFLHLLVSISSVLKWELNNIRLLKVLERTRSKAGRIDQSFNQSLQFLPLYKVILSKSNDRQCFCYVLYKLCSLVHAFIIVVPLKIDLLDSPCTLFPYSEKWMP